MNLVSLNVTNWYELISGIAKNNFKEIQIGFPFETIVVGGKLVDDVYDQLKLESVQTKSGEVRECLFLFYFISVLIFWFPLYFVCVCVCVCVFLKKVALGLCNYCCMKICDFI